MRDAKRSMRSRLSDRVSLRKSKVSSLTPRAAKAPMSSAIAWGLPEKGRRSPPPSMPCPVS